MKWLYRFIFEKAGWKIEGDVPRDLKKYIIAVAPHSSNWDFFLGLAVRSILDFKSNYLAKKELFVFPFGWLFRRLGGFPVDRKSSMNLVDQAVQIANSHEHFVVAITPEGTRKKVTKWKSGFYHIAQKAGIPIVFCNLDYGRKVVRFHPPFYPSGNLLSDAPSIAAYFKDVEGRYHSASPVI
jgi:1-acyl-sn-glycerol-3-phosphate acyltransferase